MARPNVVLIVVDQMRYDALGINNQEIDIFTPTLNMMANQGYHFTNFYSPVPTCVPARASLLSGLDAENSGRVGYEDGVPWNFSQTLPHSFSQLGYQTEAIGKMHVYPARKRLGFDHVILNDGYLHFDRKYNKPYGEQFEHGNDYLYFLKQQVGIQADIIDEGLQCNSWEARPWPLEEYLHPTNWLVSESIRFLERRDPTVPFFLKLSFEKPHAPLNPPAYYFDLYMDSLPDEIDLHMGNWEKDMIPNESIPDIDALKGSLHPAEIKRMWAAYLGLITHLDHQILRFMMKMEEFDLQNNTIYWFISDHGEQLGEHGLFRKGYPYQGSIHVPSFIYDPGSLLSGKKRTIDDLIKLQDIFPSLIDLVGGTVPKVDGKSLKKLLDGEISGWRTYIHGEHALGEDSNQFILTKEWKLIWYPVRDEYQLFNLVMDPNEKVNLFDDDKYATIILSLKNQLIKALEKREEGFVKDGKLCKVPLDQIKSTLSFVKR